MSWTRKQRADLAGDPAATLAAALRYLGRREYTAHELEQRLAQRGAAPEHIEAALSYVQERGFQDDARAGEAHIRQRINYAPRGRGLVRQELRQRGLSRDLTDALLEEYYPPEIERELLQKTIAKLGTQEWQKLARHLASKGFHGELITEELEKFWA